MTEVEKDKLSAGVTPPPLAKDQDGLIKQRLIGLSGPLSAEPGTAMRRVLVEAAAKALGQSPRTIYRLLKRYEDQGENGLGHRRPENAGKSRVVITREFDRAFRQAGYGERLLWRLREKLDDILAALWKSPMQAVGHRRLGRYAAKEFERVCRQEGMNLPTSCHALPRRTVERFRHLRIVDVYRRDRKAYSDQLPRITRTWNHLAPLSWVVADVKHFDILVRRQDGSVATPKGIAFLDTGTQRVFIHLVLLESGEGIRQEHVTEAFIALAADERWGLPGTLYLDNGTEFKNVDRLRQAIARLNTSGVPTKVKAKPYNPQSKPVEGWFGRFDRHVVSVFPGYIGSDRMKKKSQSLGRPTDPYPGGWVELKAALQDGLRAYNTYPIGSGEFAGRSPEDWLALKVGSGWRALIADDTLLDSAFCDQDSYRVHRRTIRIGTRRFSHPQLDQRPDVKNVEVALPWRREELPLFRICAESPWLRLEIDQAYAADSLAGVQASKRRLRASADGIKGLEAVGPEIDAFEMVRTEHFSPISPVNKPILLVDLSDRSSVSLAQARKKVASDLKDTAEERRKRQMSELERWEGRTRAS